MDCLVLYCACVCDFLISVCQCAASNCIDFVSRSSLLFELLKGDCNCKWIPLVLASMGIKLLVHSRHHPFFPALHSVFLPLSRSRFMPQRCCTQFPSFSILLSTPTRLIYFCSLTRHHHHHHHHCIAALPFIIGHHLRSNRIIIQS